MSLCALCLLCAVFAAKATPASIASWTMRNCLDRFSLPKVIAAQADDRDQVVVAAESAVSNLLMV
jgi:hypothetical protein